MPGHVQSIYQTPVCEYHMLFKCFLIFYTNFIYTALPSVSFLQQFIFTLSLSSFMYMKVRRQLSPVCSLCQISVVSCAFSMSTSPLLHALLLFCCSLDRKLLVSCCAEVAAAGCSRLMVARLVSVMEELWW